jgi:hypothetical protein
MAAAITLVFSPLRTYLACVAELLITAAEASFCAEIAILAITCVYLYLHQQSTIVVLAFLLIALDRRAQDVLRRRAASTQPLEPRFPSLGR